MAPTETNVDLQTLARLQAAHTALRAQMSRVIVGQNDVIELLLIALFCRGHVILEGAPGLAKTLMISTLAKLLSLSFSRIQFTPDLMPADITGSDVLEENKSTGAREYRFLPGPVFANVVLADEINRTPPKTQAALLEAMQERQVTIGRVRHPLAAPFLVLATQNPLEQEGTYPLPEAQQDRFLLKCFVTYPSFQEEFEIAKRTTSSKAIDLAPALSAEDILLLQDLALRTPISDHVICYALAIVRQTRPGEPGAPEFVKSAVAWGAGPRGAQSLILAAKVRALLQGRQAVSCQDIAALAKPTLRHRLVMTFVADAEKITPDIILQRILDTTPDREDELSRDRRFSAVLAS